MKQFEIVISSEINSESNALTIEEVKCIEMYEELVNMPNILEYLLLQARLGYLIGLEKPEGQEKYIFYSVNVNWYKTHWPDGTHLPNLRIEFKYGLVFFCKKMLTDWHKKNKIHVQAQEKYKREETSPGIYQYRKVEIPAKEIVLQLDRKQRGMITKILKIYNKEKRVTGIR